MTPTTRMRPALAVLPALALATTAAAEDPKPPAPTVK